MIVRDDAGFSMVELVVATCVMTMVMAAVFLILSPSSSMFTTQAEATDMQQRLRVATQALYRDLTNVGAGPMLWTEAGALNRFFAPVLPYDAGATADPPGTFRTDAVSLSFTRSAAGQARLRVPMPAQSGIATLDTTSACPDAGVVCGFTVGALVCVYDDSGAHDLFTVVVAGPSMLTLRHETADSGHVYAAGSPIVELASYSYFLRTDPATGVAQLARSEGETGSAIPLVDHVVDFTLEYFGDPAPPGISVLPPASSQPITTYGPSPPPFDQQTSTYPPGENCAFVNVGEAYAARLVPLSATGSLARLTAAELTDGPWCPDESHPRRFDADLFRIREIAVTIRVESALAAFRGPAGDLFLNGGTSRSATRRLPDMTTRFRVAPPNLSVEAWRHDEE